MQENNIILYQDDNEITRVSVRFADEDLWLTQGQLVEIYQTSKSNVSEHIKHIFGEGELMEDSVVRNFRPTELDGKAYMTTFYNLDMIIALGYRVHRRHAFSTVGYPAVERIYHQGFHHGRANA